jgi:ribose transport system ATP-binding protein
MGENGAGKSTLVKILSGVLQPDSGQIHVDQQLLPHGSVRRAHTAGVYCVFQELSLVPDWTVAENLMLRDRRLGRVFSKQRSGKECVEVLERYQLSIDPLADVRTLSLAERQQLEIVRAIHAAPKVLILDEASSALPPVEVQWLFQQIRDLTVRGTTVIYVSHRLSEIEEIADRGTVLRDGNVVMAFDRRTYNADEIVTGMAGRPLSRVFPARPASPGSEAELALHVEGLMSDGLDNVSLTVKRGEILGVGGLQGHGQTELLKALYGVVQARARAWSVNGTTIRRLTPSRAVRVGIGFVPEDRKTEGVALQLPVGENLLLPWLRLSGLGGRPLVRRQTAWLARVITTLKVKAPGLFAAAQTLSGGNQQKLVLGRWLGRNRGILLLHDATRGIDVHSKSELYAAIVEQAAQGTAMLWFSTDVEELVHVCHRVIVLHRGRVADELSGDRLTAENVVGAAFGRENK